VRVFDQVKGVFTRGAKHRVAPRRATYRILIATGVLLVAAAVAWQVNATLFTTHSERVGRALVHRFLQNRALNAPVTGGGPGAGSATLASCSQSTRGGDPVKGLLEIPKLDVVAPVEQGTGDSVLAVAVGHDPYSVWPGVAGNSVLEAHDVSYFVGLPKLSAGDTVQYVAPCTTYTFQVTAHTVVSEGSPVYDTPGPTITLVTCWPTDALWFTPDRYLVTASQVSASSTGNTRQYMTASAPPTVPVPPPLASEGVTLATYSLPMGTFALSGNPDPTWAQTTNPLLVQTSAVEAYIAGIRSLVQDRLDWWRSFAPGVGPPAPLVGARNPGYLTPLNVTVEANGTQATAVTLANTVSVSGGSAPGRYSVTVKETIQKGTLTISSWVLQPA
jgi:sortase A